MSTPTTAIVVVLHNHEVDNDQTLINLGKQAGPPLVPVLT